MYQITVKNLGTNRQFGQRFPTQEAAVAWHKKHLETHGDETANPPAAVVTITDVSDDVVAQAQKQLLQNYTDVESANLAPVAAAKVLAWATAGNAKAKAVMAWDDSLWAEYRTKLAQLAAGKPVVLTPSTALLDKPYSFADVQAEALKNVK